MSRPQPSQVSIQTNSANLPVDSPTGQPPALSRRQLVQRLRQQVASGSLQPLPVDCWISSGCLALDALLPSRQGFRRGSLVEWFATEPGNGAGTLALLAARHACSDGGTLVVVDGAGQFYPPAAAACGIDLERLVMIRPESAEDGLWALDQALRCSAVKAVWGWLGAINDRWFRRYQLSAEQSGCLGLFLRPAQYRGDPSWSEVQLRISAIQAGAEKTRETEASCVTANRVTASRVTASCVTASCVTANRVTTSDVTPSRHLPLSCAASQELDGHQWIQVELVRCRGLAQGSSLRPTVSDRSVGGEIGDQKRWVTLTLQEHHGSLQAFKAPEHETPTLHLVSKLADPTLSDCSTGT